VNTINATPDSWSGLTPTQVARLAREIYGDAHSSIKYRQGYRPYICPFHLLLNQIPQGASVLDVGCGAGLFILLLARLGRIRSGVGFDVDDVAIRAAQGAAAQIWSGPPIRFEQHRIDEAWPKGRFDVVSIIDVMHHVPPKNQQKLIITAVEHLNDGGLLLYKDMGRRPLWRSLANRLHDLIIAREWIHYATMDSVMNWATSEGLQLIHNNAVNMLWYRNEYCLFLRPT
jgi:2-polyprenyl-3-methyl-5-hydroxy-6-metoxy-1,4-benzoquinol methylase